MPEAFSGTTFSLGPGTYECIVLSRDIPQTVIVNNTGPHPAWLAGEPEAAAACLATAMEVNPDTAEMVNPSSGMQVPAGGMFQISLPVGHLVWAAAREETTLAVLAIAQEWGHTFYAGANNAAPPRPRARKPKKKLPPPKSLLDEAKDPRRMDLDMGDDYDTKAFAVSKQQFRKLVDDMVARKVAKELRKALEPKPVDPNEESEAPRRMDL